MKTIILAAVLMTAQLIIPAAAAENVEWTDGNFGVYAEYSRYIPEDAEDTVRISNGYAKVKTGNGFRFGGLYRLPNIPVAVEASLLLAEGDMEFGSDADSLSGHGDWELTHKMIGVRFAPNLEEDFQFSAGGGLSLWDASFDQFIVPDDDGSEPYFSVFGGWRFIHASWLHIDGDNAIGLGANIWL